MARHLSCPQACILTLTSGIVWLRPIETMTWMCPGQVFASDVNFRGLSGAPGSKSALSGFLVRGPASCEPVLAFWLGKDTRAHHGAGGGTKRCLGRGAAVGLLCISTSHPFCMPGGQPWAVLWTPLEIRTL